MGYKFIDQYSILHFATGILAYFWGMDLWTYFYIHLIFEIVENTNWGMNIINRYVKIWPGGKEAADNVLNSSGDIIFGCVGWIVSYLLDGWYKNM